MNQIALCSDPLVTSWLIVKPHLVGSHSGLIGNAQRFLLSWTANTFSQMNVNFCLAPFFPFSFSMENISVLSALFKEVFLIIMPSGVLLLEVE